MPALTYSQVEDSLGSYKEPGSDFRAALNQVLPRLYSTGIYRDLTIQYQLPLVNGCITLPKDADSILSAQLNGYKADVRSLWHDFKAAGMSGSVEPSLWGLVDAGYHATMISIPEGTTAVFPVPSAYDPDKSALDLMDITIEVIGTDGLQIYKADADFEFAVPVSNITSIKFNQEAGNRIVDLRLDEDDPDSVIAVLGPENMVSRYRRFRIPAATDTTTVHVLVKRAFEPISRDEDLVYISNLAAIKHGLLALIAEDNADIERAQYHWTEAQKNMEFEMESARGSAIPNVQFDIMGIGSHSVIRPMM
jgi:hypothetical protein